MALTNIILDTAPTELFTSPVDTTTAIVVTYLCNTDSNAVQFNFYAVPVGSLADATTLIYKEVNLAASDTYILDTEKLILDAGDGLWADATTTGVVVVTVNTIGV